MKLKVRKLTISNTVKICDEVTTVTYVYEKWVQNKVEEKSLERFCEKHRALCYHVFQSIKNQMVGTRKKNVQLENTQTGSSKDIDRYKKKRQF